MLEVSFNPFPILETENLLLRQFSLNDVSAFFEMRSNEKLMHFIPRPLATQHKDVEDLINLMNNEIANNNSISWAITLKNTGELLGSIGFVRMQKENHRAEIGYMLNTKHQGKGLMHQAITACINYGFNTMKLHTIEAVIDPANTASEKVLQKSNFIKEAHFKQNFFYKNEFLDTVHYGLLNPKKF